MLCLAAVAWVVAEAPDDGPLPDRWHGLVLDESTIDQAREVLGPPKKEKEEKFYSLALRNEFDKETRLLWLEWKDVTGFDKVRLGFGSEKKLVVIHLDLKEKLPPAALAHNYRMAFEPAFDGMSVAAYPGRYEQSQGRIYTTQFPNSYYLVAVAERSLVFAWVTQGTMSMFGKQMLGMHDTQGFPGSVEALQLVGRSLLTKKGSDILR